MSVFSALATACHRVERFFARRHRDYWRFRNARRTVAVTFENTPDGWRARQAHTPAKNVVDAHPTRERELREMSLRAAVRDHDAGICPHCFGEYAYAYDAHPY